MHTGGGVICNRNLWSMTARNTSYELSALSYKLRTNVGKPALPETALKTSLIGKSHVPLLYLCFIWYQRILQLPAETLTHSSYTWVGYDKLQLTRLMKVITKRRNAACCFGYINSVIGLLWRQNQRLSVCVPLTSVTILAVKMSGSGSGVVWSSLEQKRREDLSGIIFKCPCFPFSSIHHVFSS